MTRVEMRHRIACSIDRFWELYLDPDWTREMIIDGLGWGTCEVGEIEDRDGIRIRQMTSTPRLELPESVVKVVGPRLSFTETGRFDTKRRHWEFETKLAVLSDRIKIGGDMHIEPAGDDACIRVANLYADARIFAIGGLVERAAKKNMHTGWDEAAAWINGWLARNPASAPN